MKNSMEAARMAGYISEFLHDYAPQFLTSSEHTLKSYRDALTLYIVFLEEKGITHDRLGRICFERKFIEEWIIWLKNVRHCTPESCNIRLSSLRVFPRSSHGKPGRAGPFRPNREKGSGISDTSICNCRKA